MKIDLKGSAAFSYLDVELAPGETLITEPDAMASMAADLDLDAKFNGGFIKGLLRKYLGGESLFINHFSNNTNGPRTLTVVQPTPGALRCIDLQGNSFCLQPGAFLACTPGVTISLRWAGFVSLLAREGLFKLEVSGTGQVWYGAYGELLEREVDGEFIVDSGHLVGYEPQMQLKLQLAGGIFSSLFGGEGLVTRLQGKGKIIIQTRSISGLVGWLNPKLP
ncbi:TIGR00266 family protein [Permianibacter sp. IMCC34836]|uniref:TIGR00266 family protein n=1 Tax=Permianibacter fluminis TaxID=2738515 RepID=UPI0015582C72|nr:TIGR00266 family protein [Permianibacter fluminis]NQD35682.1 TIGR00266 family protein [Permianibacter fluminis]